MDEPLPRAVFEQDSISCKVLGNESGEWRFVPMHGRPGDEEWFELEFSLPPLVAELVEQNWNDPIAVAAAKQRHFSYIDLSGVIGGIRRNIRLERDRDWLHRYLEWAQFLEAHVGRPRRKQEHAGDSDTTTRDNMILTTTSSLPRTIQIATTARLLESRP